MRAQGHHHDAVADLPLPRLPRTTFHGPIQGQGLRAIQDSNLPPLAPEANAPAFRVPNSSSATLPRGHVLRAPAPMCQAHA